MSPSGRFVASGGGDIQYWTLWDHSGAASGAVHIDYVWDATSGFL